MRFFKYHALGNDYIVLRDSDGLELNESQIVRVCHRHYGIGSDGILLYHGKNPAGEFPLRIFNPDGSEAEKSGNGLRIFSRFLWDQKEVASESFKILTPGGLVEALVEDEGKKVTVEMGRVSFQSKEIPVAGEAREVLNEEIIVDSSTFTYCAASIGNPHCVVMASVATSEDAKRFGPTIEVDPRFPNRTNVQFMQVLDRNNIRIEIWERGAGYTLASGSSSSASAAVAKRLGLCDDNITVHMPGGTLQIHVDNSFQVRMCGSVTRVAEGNMFKEIFE